MVDMPSIQVEVAFASTPDDPSPVWTDISAYAQVVTPITISRGRSDELSDIQPSRLQVMLDNRDGRFTPGNTGSPYYPNVKKNRRIRVSATPVTATPNPSFEDDLTGWEAKGAGNSIEHVTTDAQAGSACVRLTGTGTANRIIDHGEDTNFLTPASAGQTWSAGAYGKWETGATPRNVRVDVRFLDAALTYIQSDLGTSEATNTSTWVQTTSLAAVAPANTAWVTVRVVYLSPAANDAGLVDSVQLEPGSTLTTIRRRLTGYVDEWPVQWPDGGSGYAWSMVSASSRRARLAVGAQLRSIIETEILADSPTAYYPMGEPPPKGAGQAADVSVNMQPNLVATGTGTGIQWQAATGPGTDSLSAPVFADGRYLELTRTEVVAADGSFTLEAFVTTEDSGTARSAVSLWPPGTGLRYLTLGIDTSGHLQATSLQVYTTNPTDYIMTSSATINDGEVHHIAVREDLSGAPTSMTVTLWLDGVQVDSDSVISLANTPSRERLLVGGFAPDGGAQSGGWIGSVSHVALFDGVLSSTRIAAHADSGLTGFSGESSDARIERLADYADVPAGEVSTETGASTSITNQDTTDKVPIEAMDEVTRTEAGVLFDATDGTLTFHARTHRYNAAVAFTLDADLGQILPSIEARLDGQQLVNDITAMSTGIDSDIRVLDQDSIDEHGVARDQFESLTTSAVELLDAANWRLHLYADPDVRVHSVVVNLLKHDAALAAALLDAEIGDKVTLDNLPAQAPASSIDVFIEGITETIGGLTYTIGFELTPADPYEVWELDSATHSQLGTTTVLAFKEACMTWTDPRTWVAGETVTAALMNTHVRDNLKEIGDAWGSYTPTLGNWTVGNGTLTGRFLQAGKLVHFSISFTLGSTSGTTGTLQIDLPTNAFITGGPITGLAHLLDTSASGRWNRLLSTNGGGANNRITLRDLGHTAVNGTTPFTFASGDTIEIAGTYEAA